ncbi:MAG: hypothetical protein DCF20_07000 [Pseudanabaena sp.]|nr:MAG: hypothetical protein DCF20_07000 [Pseudanabaena sp.]
MSYSQSESITLSRRYELPTCLLEVWTDRSPLSDWQSQIVAQNLRFRLQLDRGKKIIKGNQQQIANLIEVVTNYCDRWLAQDEFDTLNHEIVAPQLPKLKLSTLQLFDLYESLELCTNEFVILPNLVLEVRRLNPNWLKIIAGAIAIVGVSIGTIRLISPPFGEQPSYQIASTPAASDPEKVPIPPASFEDKAAIHSKVGASPKSTTPINPNANSSVSESKNNIAVPPGASSSSQSSSNISRDRKDMGRTDKVTISPESGSNDSINRQRATENLPSIADSLKPSSPATKPSRMEPPDQVNSSQSSTFGRESAQSSSAPSAKLSTPLPTTRESDDNIAITNIKVLQVQSELPSNITADLVRYIQTKQITTSTTGTISFELAISGNRISSISAENKGSILKDANTISELEKRILEWRSPNPTAGTIRLVLQLSR